MSFGCVAIWALFTVLVRILQPERKEAASLVALNGMEMLVVSAISLSAMVLGRTVIIDPSSWLVADMERYGLLLSCTLGFFLGHLLLLLPLEGKKKLALEVHHICCILGFVMVLIRNTCHGYLVLLHIPISTAVCRNIIELGRYGYFSAKVKQWKRVISAAYIVLELTPLILAGIRLFVWDLHSTTIPLDCKILLSSLLLIVAGVACYYVGRMAWHNQRRIVDVICVSSRKVIRFLPLCFSDLYLCGMSISTSRPGAN